MSDTVPIIQLRQRTTLLSTDNFPIAPANGGALRVSADAVLAYVQAGITTPGLPLTQYASPTTGQTVTVAPATSGQPVRLLLTPAGTLATLTVVLPGTGGSATPVDKQEVIIISTQIVTVLTVSAGTTTVTGALAALAANVPFKMFYDATNSSWYRTT